MSEIEIKVPTIGESVTEVTLAAWLVEDGAIVKMDEPICEFESDKATLELPAEKSGRLIHVAKVGEDLKIGDVVARIDTSVSVNEEKSPQPKKESSDEVKKSAPAKDGGKKENVTSSASYATGTPSPAAEKILKEKDITPAEVSGTGKDGRVSEDGAQNPNTGIMNRPSRSAPTNTSVDVPVSRATTPASDIEKKRSTSLQGSLNAPSSSRSPQPAVRERATSSRELAPRNSSTSTQRAHNKPSARNESANGRRSSDRPSRK